MSRCYASIHEGVVPMRIAQAAIHGAVPAENATPAAFGFAGAVVRVAVTPLSMESLLLELPLRRYAMQSRR